MTRIASQPEIVFLHAFIFGVCITTYVSYTLRAASTIYMYHLNILPCITIGSPQIRLGLARFVRSATKVSGYPRTPETCLQQHFLHDNFPKGETRNLVGAPTASS